MLECHGLRVAFDQDWLGLSRRSVGPPKGRTRVRAAKSQVLSILRKVSWLWPMFAGDRGATSAPSVWPSTRYVTKWVVAAAVSGESDGDQDVRAHLPGQPIHRSRAEVLAQSLPAFDPPLVVGPFPDAVGRKEVGDRARLTEVERPRHLLDESSPAWPEVHFVR